LKKLVNLLLSLLITTLILSCNHSGPVDENGVIQEAPIHEGMSRVSFNFDQSDYPAEIASKGPYDANEIIYFDVQTGDFRHVPLSEGINKIDVVKDRIYVFGLVYNPFLNQEILARDISTLISLLGNFSVASLGLDSLPISDTGADLIDLGELNFSTDTFNSTIGSLTASELLGHPESALATYGLTDGTLMQYLNPDIDHNGIYDADENIFWKVELILDIPIFNGDYIYETGEFVNDFSNFEKLYNAFFQIGMGPALPEYPIEEIQLKLPDFPQAYDSGNQPVDYLSSHNVGYVENERMYGFGLMGIETPSIPISGDYVFINGPENYYFDNLEFVSISSDFEGYIFPIIDLTTNSNNIYTNIAWKWLKIIEGTVSPADRSEVSLYIQQIDFFIGSSGYTDPITLGVDPYEENSVDISHLNQENLETFIFKCVTKGNTYLRFHFETFSRPYS
jgi:hypothetical protein